MLTDLSFLDIGKPFPPESEKKRLATYKENKGLFEAEHTEVFKENMQRLLREASEMTGRQVSYEIVVNLFKLISTISAGMLFNSPPNIVVGAENDQEAMDVYSEIEERSELANVLYSVALDVSRFGTGLFYLRKDEDGKALIDISRPDVWFPVVEPINVRRIKAHVLAVKYSEGTGHNKKEYVKMEIHERGKVTTRLYSLISGALGTVLEESIEATGLSDFAIIPVHNLRPSDAAFGVDDYNDIQSLVCELEVRLGQISKILDKHSSPSMQGPESAIEVYEDKDGNLHKVVEMGKYFVNQVGSEHANISYLTWDAQLEANFKQIEQILELLRSISEMGALLSDTAKLGNVPSGSALRRMLYLALSKIARLKNSFTPAIKKLVKAACELAGLDMSKRPVFITWSDSLPVDAKELAEIAAIRTGSKQTQSVKRAIMGLDAMSEDDAERELALIRQEQDYDLPEFEDRAEAGLDD